MMPTSRVEASRKRRDREKAIDATHERRSRWPCRPRRRSTTFSLQARRSRGRSEAQGAFAVCRGRQPVCASDAGLHRRSSRSGSRTPTSRSSVNGRFSARAGRTRCSASTTSPPPRFVCSRGTRRRTRSRCRAAVSFNLLVTVDFARSSTGHRPVACRLSRRECSSSDPRKRWSSSNQGAARFTCVRSTKERFDAIECQRTRQRG
jgi:hypothetical protein